MYNHTALVRYTEGQVDGEGRPVSTDSFYVDFQMDVDGDVIEGIEKTGHVQFNWILKGVA